MARGRQRLGGLPEQPFGYSACRRLFERDAYMIVTRVRGDVSKQTDLDRLHAAVKKRRGHIDILFANTGGGGIRTTEGNF
jgi:NAD(P)-dependent dehydrogenase (short-subunit alcohol dehydrogenase family)